MPVSAEELAVQALVVVAAVAAEDAMKGSTPTVQVVVAVEAVVCMRRLQERLERVVVRPSPSICRPRIRRSRTSRSCAELAVPAEPAELVAKASPDRRVVVAALDSVQELVATVATEVTVVSPAVVVVERVDYRLEFSRR